MLLSLSWSPMGNYDTVLKRLKPTAFGDIAGQMTFSKPRGVSFAVIYVGY